MFASDTQAICECFEKVGPHCRGAVRYCASFHIVLEELVEDICDTKSTHRIRVWLMRCTERNHNANLWRSSRKYTTQALSLVSISIANCTAFLNRLLNQA